MKQTMILSGLMWLVSSAFGQTGTVVYNETVKLDIHIEGLDPGMAGMFPKERKSVKMLYYSPEASLYLSAKQNDDQEVTEEMAGGGTMVIKMQEPEEQYYVDLKNRKLIEQRDFMSRMFLVVSDADTLPWKLTGNRREILGTPCFEAIYQKDTVKTIAWFAPSIPVSSGPGHYTGLPGLILEVNAADGKRIISAVSVTPGEVASLIRKPAKGKKVTRDEFEKIVEEKTGEMQGEGGATMMIRISQ